MKLPGPLSDVSELDPVRALLRRDLVQTQKTHRKISQRPRRHNRNMRDRLLWNDALGFSGKYPS